MSEDGLRAGPSGIGFACRSSGVQVRRAKAGRNGGLTQRLTMLLRCPAGAYFFVRPVVVPSDTSYPSSTAPSPLPLPPALRVA